MPSTITAEHVRELLRSSDPDPRLVVLEGRAQVVPGGERGADRYRGAVEVVSRDDLAARLGTEDPSEAELDTAAAQLQTVVAALGG